jgi:beta-lactam-binding protein with PASTA domain
VTDEHVIVPDFVGMQALNAWLLGHGHGLLLQDPDPDAPSPLMHGVVAHQQPPTGTRAHRWDAVTVWLESGPDTGVREPRRTPPPNAPLQAAAEVEDG